jgi:hypothetical protein
MTAFARWPERFISALPQVSTINRRHQYSGVGAFLVQPRALRPLNPQGGIYVAAFRNVC